MPVHSNNCFVDFVADKELFIRYAKLVFQSVGYAKLRTIWYIGR